MRAGKSNRHAHGSFHKPFIANHRLSGFDGAKPGRTVLLPVHFRRLAERAEEVDDMADGMEISDRLASILAVELADAVHRLHEIANPDERWRRLQALSRELWRLRKEDHNGKRLQLQEAQWEHQVERENEADRERLKEQHRQRLMARCLSPLFEEVNAECFGGGEHGKRMARLITRIKFDQPFDDLLEAAPKNCSSPIRPDQTESNQIQPDEAKAS